MNPVVGWGVLAIVLTTFIAVIPQLAYVVGRRAPVSPRRKAITIAIASPLLVAACIAYFILSINFIGSLTHA